MALIVAGKEIVTAVFLEEAYSITVGIDNLIIQHQSPFM